MLRVVSLGIIIDEPRFMSRGSHLYPVGYCVEVPVFVNPKGGASRTKVILPGDETGADTHVADVYYTASIRQGSDGGPLFEVVRSDAPGVRHQAENASKPWRDAFEAAKRDFPSRVDSLNRSTPDANGVVIILGHKWFGLTYSRVIEGLKALPGAAAVFKTDTPSNVEEVVAEKPRAKKSASTAAVTKATPKKSQKKIKVESVENSQKSIIEVHKPAPKIRNPIPRAKRAKNTTPVDAHNVDANTNNDDDDDDDDDGDELVISMLKPSSSVSSISAAATASPCPDCGLVGTPFCASTGKPHAASPKSRKPRGKKSLTTTTSDTEKPKQAKRSRDPNDEGGTATHRHKGESGEPSASPTTTSTTGWTGRRGRKREKENKSSANSKSDSNSDDDVNEPSLLDWLRAKGAEVKKESAPPPPPPPPPPLWRPPLGPVESNKAVQVLQRLLRAETVIHAPFSSLLRVPMVPVKPRGGRKKKENTANDEDGEEEGAAEEEEQQQQQREHQGNEHHHNEDAGGVNNDTKLKTTADEKEKKIEEMKEKHPLDIIDVSNGVAGRRYVRFMQIYTSERTKMDLLRKAASVPVPPRGPKSAPKSNAAATPAKTAIEELPIETAVEVDQ